MNTDKVLTYLCPTKLYMGINAHRKLDAVLAEFGAKRVFLLSDPGIAATETYTIIENALREYQVSFDTFTDVEDDK